MSRALIARNRDLRRLEDEGYTLRIVDDAYLMVENVPYVTAQSQVEDSALVMELTLSADLTVRPANHVAYWAGGFPYEASGNKLQALLMEGASKVTLLIPFRLYISFRPSLTAAIATITTR